VIVVSVALFGCLGFLPRAQAVVPAPDGGYPGGNTAEEQNALLSLTTGTFNTAVGFLSLRGNVIGNFNTAVGAGTLLANTADKNTATGTAALLSNTTGVDNTANGAFALLSNTEGLGNTATGSQALFSNTIGGSNTATGEKALFNNTEGENNTAVGRDALFHNTIGDSNTVTGESAMLNNTEGGNNTANGFNALRNNTTGGQNTAVGFAALVNTTGGNNVALGASAGSAQTTGSNNVYIGQAVQGVAGESNACYIKSIFGQTSASGTAVFVNSNNKLGTATSSKRFKEDIKPMDKLSEALFSLKPVSFRYKKEIDPVGTSQLGLVAEDVERVNRDLVVRDKEGKPYSVRYDQVNAMLLNEFLKAHQRMQDQEKRIEFLTAELAKQKTLIQKVSDKVESDASQQQLIANRE
jgi:hypothetical protein